MKNVLFESPCCTLFSYFFSLSDWPLQQALLLPGGIPGVWWLDGRVGSEHSLDLDGLLLHSQERHSDGELPTAGTGTEFYRQIEAWFIWGSSKLF